MDLNKALDALTHDIRMKEFNLKTGVITKEDIEKQNKSLKDHAQDCENITLEDRDTEM
jgi:hypothetical protein